MTQFGPPTRLKRMRTDPCNWKVRYTPFWKLATVRVSSTFPVA
jgi:hypothetical protein